MFTIIKSKLNFLFWRFSDVASNLEILEYASFMPFRNLKPNFQDERINNSYHYDNQHRKHHIQFVLKVKQAIVEPDYGFVVVGFRTIVRQSVTHEKLLPSAWRFLRRKAQSTDHVQTAMLFDGHPGINYFHFFADTINKLWVFEKYLDAGIALLISEDTYRTKYFQELSQIPFLRGLNWVLIKKNQYMKVDNLYLVKPQPYEVKLWHRTLQLLQPHIKPNKKRRIFLNRNQSKGRYISNMGDILPVLKKYHFELIDTDGWSLIEQIALFSETDFLIGLHGAGLTNIMFSFKNPLHIIEINPPNRIACQYYWLANIFGYSYNCILGDVEDNQTKELLMIEGFTVDSKKLEEAILAYEFS